jgi:hypothetical protein
VVMDSHAVLRSRPRTSPGLPGPSVSLSTRALPNHPGRLDGCGCSLLPHRYQASSPSEEWPPPVVSRGRIGFACAGLTSSLAAAVPRRAPDRRTRPDRLVSRIRLPSYAEPELHGERAIHMADTSQSARQTRVALAHRRSQSSPRPRRNIGLNSLILRKLRVLRGLGDHRLAVARACSAPVRSERAIRTR